MHPTESFELVTWLKANYVTQKTCDTLHREMIRRMADFKLMTPKDIDCLNLPLGEQLRLRESIEQLRSQDKSKISQ